MGDVVGGNHLWRYGESGGAKTNFGQPAGTRGHNGPAVGRKAGEQIDSAGKRDYAFEIRDLAAFHFTVFGFMIGIWKVVPHGCETGAAVRSSDDFFRIESVFDGPLAPDALDRGSGVDKNSVHIEEEGGALNFGHNLEMRRNERL